MARAYRELELAGVVTKRRTAGTFVSEDAAPLDRAERLAIVSGRVDALLDEAKQLGISVDELLELVRRRGDAAGARRRERKDDVMEIDNDDASAIESSAASRDASARPELLDGVTA